MNERYQRHLVLSELGCRGQKILTETTAAVVGCGGLGTSIAMNLARMGFGTIVIMDKDAVELTNLHRQQLFTEEDVRLGRTKVEAAERHLKAINSQSSIRAFNTFLNSDNAVRLLQGADIVFDGSDNFSTRFIINKAASDLSIPWVYGGALGVQGMVQLFMPDRGPCFNCLIPEIPQNAPNNAEVGVIGVLPNIVGSLQVAEAIKYLMEPSTYASRLLRFDIWNGEFRWFEVPPDPGCPVCRGKIR